MNFTCMIPCKVMSGLMVPSSWAKLYIQIATTYFLQHMACQRVGESSLLSGGQLPLPGRALGERGM